MSLYIFEKKKSPKKLIYLQLSFKLAECIHFHLLIASDYVDERLNACLLLLQQWQIMLKLFYLSTIIFVVVHGLSVHDDDDDDDDLKTTTITTSLIVSPS